MRFYRGKHTGRLNTISEGLHGRSGARSLRNRIRDVIAFAATARSGAASGERPERSFRLIPGDRSMSAASRTIYRRRDMSANENASGRCHRGVEGVPRGTRPACTVHVDRPPRRVLYGRRRRSAGNYIICFSLFIMRA